ncbi:uncharacterized protein A1O5_05469 [Cladophialophora psammophila CBS 110553]|uniref:FAS1 domain-containing protein n=1 Tax=Cladophialophora psammophila CBS 110553 TaxID=1182543 RepID=W9X400_9EURO|nr:uncharacterized protein A1O5_05469 [Cladophialophora psammophila CBS 110553]EXJ71661.1 hypothetical protein A1O5_05469 [Cladophialophora psammophila CBS 110553]
MVTRGFILAALAGAALALTSADLVTVLNPTNGTSTISQVVSEVPGFLEAISGKTNLTFLAPNDTAIAELLNYYIAPTLLTSSNYTNVTGGQDVGIYYDDDENVVGFYGGLDYNPEGPATPIPFGKGWIYIINGVLQIPPSVSETVASGDFNGSSFVAALNKTGLTEQIDRLHDATYLIPDNDGFTAVEEALSELSTEQLAEVLKYHVVAGRVWHFDDFENGTQLTTLQGQSLTVSVTPAGDYFINNAGINYVDLAVSEGVVIFVDNVLNPHASWTLPVNGTEDGVPAWPVSNTASSTASASSTLATATYTGLAAAPLKTGRWVPLHCSAALHWPSFCRRMELTRPRSSTK